MENNLAPIALFVYNRLEHTKQTIEALQRNTLATESDLYIFSDGAKNESAEHNVNNVRKHLKTISGFKNINIIERKENFGLAKSIITGVTEILNKHGKIIVLEDDLITSKYFLQYMNEGLKLYQNDKNVASIHGYTFPIKNTLPETFFIKGADCWGWGTWSRAWKYFEEDGQKLLDKINNKGLAKEFNFGDNYPYTKMLKGQIKGQNNSWAIRWYASAFINNMLTLYPGKSLVNNIGLDNSGTHCNDDKTLEAKIYNNPIKIKKIKIKESQEARKEYALYFKSIKASFLRRIINKLKRWAK